MSNRLVADDFRGLTEPLVVESHVGGPAVAAHLSVESVDPLPAHRLRTDPFSVVLLGPRDPPLPQATYALKHPRLGTIQLFLVPIGQDAQGLRYEALFN